MILEFFLVDYFVFCRSRLSEILKEGYAGDSKGDDG